MAFGNLLAGTITTPTGQQVQRWLTPEQTQAVSQLGQAAMGAAGQQSQAASQAYQGYAQGMAGMYGPYAQSQAAMGGNLAQMFDSYGRNAGQYFGALSNIAGNAMQSQAQQSQGLSNAYGQGASSYMQMLGNLGAAGLAGYGQAANSAMQAQAMNSTAALKAMSDAIAANQGAVSGLGSSRNQALGALAAAQANSGSNFANARAANSQAASQMFGLGTSALGNIGGAAATALGNLGVPAASIANSDLNYTRDMAKLALARELGLTNANVASGAASNVSGALGNMQFGGGGYSISGPSGLIASASGGGSGGGGGGGGFSPAAGIYTNPYANRQWYQDRQTSDGSGQAAIRGLSRDIGAQATRGSGSVLEALAAGRAQANDTARGIDNDAAMTFGELGSTRRGIMDNDGFDRLDNNYRSGLAQLTNAFLVGQRDPRSIFNQVRGDITAMQSPFLRAGAAGMRDFYRNFPSMAGQSISASPYIDQLNAAYGPYMANLNERYGSATSNAMQLAANAGSAYNAGISQLGSNLSSTQAQMNKLFGDSAGKVLGSLTQSALDQAKDMREASLYTRKAQIEDRYALNKFRDSFLSSGYGRPYPRAVASR